MTPQEINQLTKQEKDARMMHRIRNVGQCCIDCGESLTQSEKALGWSYCLVCWPLADREEHEDE